MYALAAALPLTSRFSFPERFDRRFDEPARFLRLVRDPVLEALLREREVPDSARHAPEMIAFAAGVC